LITSSIARGAVVLAVAPALLRESRTERRGRLDTAGAILATGGLSLLVFGLLDKGARDWTDGTVLLRLLGGLALLAAFVAVESRVSEPLVPLRFFRSRNRSTANLVSMLFGASFAAMFFTLTLYMQQVLGFSALRTGFLYLPFGGMLLLSIAISSQLMPRIGVKPVMIGGMLIAAAGLLLWSRIQPGGSYLADVLPGMLVLPLGAGAGFVTSTVAAVDGADGEDAGLASGVLNAGQQVGLGDRAVSPTLCHRIVERQELMAAARAELGVILTNW
jgi:predicted MFS family arabinose efflux permease